MRDWSPHTIQQTPLTSDEEVERLIRGSWNYSHGLPVILLITPSDELLEVADSPPKEEA